MIEWSQFHFLRPLWWLAALPALWLWWRLRQQQHPFGPWGRLIEPHFLRALQPEAHPVSRPLNALLALWLLLIFALSGPTWHYHTVPAHPTRSGTVIVLDLSASMLAQDIPPSRIQRVRYKLIDLLRAHPEHPFGLVVYAGSAHIAMPISQDTATLLNLIPALSPAIMPRPGSHPLEAMQLADQLFQNTHTQQGHIIWVTDDLDEPDALRRFFTRHDYSLAILAVGTPEGAPIPLPDRHMLHDAEGRLVIARLPWAALKQFARTLQAPLTPLTLNDEDLKLIAPPLSASRTDSAQSRAVRQWQDWGPWLAVAGVLLAALLFRRGWLPLWLLTISLLWSPSFPLLAAERQLSDWRDIFRTPDQQGWHQWQEKHYARACDLFEHPGWKGAACYRAGRLKEAERAWRKWNTPEAFYNLGNLYVRQRAWRKAINAYRTALKRRPDFPQAQDNLQRLLAFLAHQTPSAGHPPSSFHTAPAQASSLPTASSGATPDANAQVEKTAPASQPSSRHTPPAQPAQHTSTETASPASSQATAPPSSASSSQGPSTEPPAATSSEGTPVPLMHPKGPVSPSKPDGTMSPSTTTRNPLDTWLQRIPDQPGLFLKRKFRHQLNTMPQRKRDAKRW